MPEFPLLVIRLLLWTCANLPYFTCCLFLFYKPIRALGKGRTALFAAFLAAYLLVPFLWREPSGPRLVLYLIISLPTCFVGVAVASALSRMPMRTALYGLFSGINATVAIGLPILILDQSMPDISNLVIFTGVLLLGALLSLFCFILLRAHVLPYLEILSSLSIQYFDAAPAVYMTIMLVFYAGNFGVERLLLQCVACLLCMWGTYSAYSLSGKLLFQRMDNMQVLQRSSYLESCVELQQAQYAALGEQLKLTRAIRHDIRHHLKALEQYIRDGDRERLIEYLPYLQKELAQIHSEPSICVNSAVDAVARHYLNRAREAGAQLDIRMEINEDFAIPSFDLCIIIGNYLENAVEALQRGEGQSGGYIRLRAQQVNDMFTLVATNSYRGKLLVENDEYRSTKRYGMEGIGLSSIRSIVNKYEGNCEIKAEDGVFTLSLILFARKEGVA